MVCVVMVKAPRAGEVKTRLAAPLTRDQAAASLSKGEADVALGPTEDGGYYLVGLRESFEGLFRNVEWSTPRVYRQTASNAARLGLRVLELPRWYDVDTREDLLRLRYELRSDEGARERAPHTR